MLEQRVFQFPITPFLRHWRGVLVQSSLAYGSLENGTTIESFRSMPTKQEGKYDRSRYSHSQ